MFYVYILKNEKGNVYYGSTNDLRKRLKEHNKGQVFSTKNHKWKLVYYEAYYSEKDARIRERRLKQYGQVIAKLKERIKNSFKES